MKYGDIIKLKDDVMPQMSLDVDTFFSLCDKEDIDEVKCWGLPVGAFEVDDMGFVYLKSEYAKELVWAIDEVIEFNDGDVRLNINVAYDPNGIVNCGAFCSYINENDVLEIL